LGENNQNKKKKKEGTTTRKTKATRKTTAYRFGSQTLLRQYQRIFPKDKFIKSQTISKENVPKNINVDSFKAYPRQIRCLLLMISENDVIKTLLKRQEK
jgi:hypothetical protein